MKLFFIRFYRMNQDVKQVMDALDVLFNPQQQPTPAQRKGANKWLEEYQKTVFFDTLTPVQRLANLGFFNENAGNINFCEIILCSNLPSEN